MLNRFLSRISREHVNLRSVVNIKMPEDELETFDQPLNVLPLPPPAKQTQCAKAGGEERECGGEWNGVQLPSDLATREHRSMCAMTEVGTFSCQTPWRR
jgi:hypothetical protein